MDAPTTALSSLQVADAAGVTYRMLDWWIRRELVVPSIRAANGQGTRRIFSVDDLRLVWALSRVAPMDRRLVSHALRERPDARFVVVAPGRAQAVGTIQAAAGLINSSPLTTILDMRHAPTGG